MLRYNDKLIPDYVNVNPEANKTLLLVHGWPSLWASWSNQIEDLKVGVVHPQKSSYS